MFVSGYLKTIFISKTRWLLQEDVVFTSNCLSKDEQALLKEVGANIIIEDKFFTITISKGTASDLASVPKFLWWFLAPWDIAQAAILHDHTHQTSKKYQKLKNYNKDVYIKARAVSNKLFLYSMKTLQFKPSIYKIYLVYVTVMITTYLRDKLEK